MNFADLFFIYAFLPVVLILYHLIPHIQYKNVVLLIVSLLFYAWGNPVMVLLLIGYALLNYAVGRLISTDSAQKRSQVILAVALVLDIGLLFGFKYLTFFWNTFVPSSMALSSIAAPLGLSFFSFRTISYLLDVYWQKVPVERSFLHFLLFVSLFPCTVAGPIVRYQTIGGDLHRRKMSRDDFYQGIIRICIGLGKKVILADQLYQMVTYYLGGSLEFLTVSESWFALLIYTLYVYFDFSGYSDMAIGLGRLFGFRFEENFNYPFICTTISEFWQRWHISLGSFFRDYLLYVPIFGRMRRYGGLFLVWFCTGLWHGASWNYVIWGLYFGLFIFLETLLGKKKIKKIPVIIRHIYTKFVIVIGFAIFYFTDMQQMGVFFKCLFGFAGNGFMNEFSSVYMMNHIFLVAISFLCALPLAAYIRRKMEARLVTQALSYTVQGIWALMLFVFSSFLLVSASNHPFLYTQF